MVIPGRAYDATNLGRIIHPESGLSYTGGPGRTPRNSFTISPRGGIPHLVGAARGGAEFNPSSKYRAAGLSFGT